MKSIGILGVLALFLVLGFGVFGIVYSIDGILFHLKSNELRQVGGFSFLLGFSLWGAVRSFITLVTLNMTDGEQGKRDE